MIVKLLTEHHLEFLSLKGGCRGSSESILVKMPHCWKSHATAHFIKDWNSYFRLALGDENIVYFNVVKPLDFSETLNPYIYLRSIFSIKFT